jgi:hypothetical protein
MIKKKASLAGGQEDKSEDISSYARFGILMIFF